ncbi:MAG: hypothetical protein WAP13_08275 [Brevefilum fermentans]
MYTLNTMPDLKHRLGTQDLGFLEIVAELWGVELTVRDIRLALSPLIRAMLDPTLVIEIIESLPGNARRALNTLVAEGGWLPWARFNQEFGPLREVGPGRRDREKPFLDPISPAEILWYRALIGRDFLRRGGELQECAYIPDDLLTLIPPVKQTKSGPPGRAASPGETSHILPVTDRILDHTCTLLAALRLGDPQRSPAVKTWRPPLHVVHALLGAVKLITSEEQPVAEDARPFLEMPRAEALSWLVRGWRTSHLFNELRLVPSLICEGAWQNDPVSTRERLLALLSELPEGIWWHLESFVQEVFKRAPDFQRPAGDFDTWLIRDAHSGEPLNGIQHWDRVDGALLRYLITGPLHWLGMMDLAAPAEGQPATAFRFSAWAEQLLLGLPVTQLADEDQPVSVFSDGRLAASVHTLRLARYQLARFCLWIDENETEYIYQMTPASLGTASKQGLKITHLEILLHKYAESTPPNLVTALRQWYKKGGQAHIQPAVILRVETPRILQLLRESPAGRFLGDSLGPTSVILNPGTQEKVAAALARLGYLADIEYPESSDPEDGPGL